MNRDDFAAFCVQVAFTDDLGTDPMTPVKTAKRILRHAKRLRTLTDERAIQRILKKVEVLTGTPWEAETSDGITYLVGPFFIPHD